MFSLAATGVNPTLLDNDFFSLQIINVLGPCAHTSLGKEFLHLNNLGNLRWGPKDGIPSFIWFNL